MKTRNLRTQTGLRAGDNPPTNQEGFNYAFNRRNQTCLSYVYPSGEQILDVECAHNALLSTIEDCIAHHEREDTCYGFASYYHAWITDYEEKHSSGA
jgi:hypothetical protein